MSIPSPVTTLATLGIVLGVASVIVMRAVAEASRYEAVRQIKQLGATNVIARSVKPTRDTQETEQILTYGLTHGDLTSRWGYDWGGNGVAVAESSTPRRSGRRPGLRGLSPSHPVARNV